MAVTGMRIARIDGYFYNDTYGPGSGLDYNGYEGNVWVGFFLNYDGDGTRLFHPNVF